MNFDAQKLEDHIHNHTEPEPFSGTVLLTRDEEVLFESAHGLAHKAASIPNRLDTRFQMASGCKIFTSVAICQFVERGALSWDTPLRECVDVVFPHYAPDITIRHLLTHNSGITSYFEEDVDPDYEALWADLPLYRVRRPRDFLPLFQDKPMKFPPGDRFDYNDGGYILLGLAVECVSGLEFANYVEGNVLAPAGMKDSGYFAADQLPARTANAYIRQADGTWRTNAFAVPIIGAPDGGAYTTAPDMQRFWQAMTEHRLLDPETTRQLLDTQVTTGSKSPYTHYGYGVWTEQSGSAVRKHFVEGSDPGVAFRSAMYPGEDVTLTILGNTERTLWPLYRGIEELLAL